MLTQKLELVQIPSILDSSSHRWKVRALKIEGKSPALAKLVEWEKSEPENFKKIITSLRMAAREFRVTIRKYVAKCNNRDVYEAIAHSMEARLMFFYSETEKAIICTNHCWKTSDNQDAAFSLCATFKALFETQYGKKAPSPPKRNR